MRSRLSPGAIIGLAAVVLAVAGGAVWLASSGDQSPKQQSATTAPAPAPTDFSDRFAGYEPAPEPNGKLSKVNWPNFVTSSPPEVKRLYEFQIKHGELMRYMPCFCGCHQEDGHRSNRDCYVERVNPDGSVVLDPMAPT